MLVFVAVAAVDALWSLWIGSVGGHHAAQAGAYATLLLLAGAFVTLSYVRDRRLLLPAALGAFIGTYLSVRFG